MTTTTTAPAGTTPASVDYPMPYETGAYVARIVGPHGRYGLDREFLEGKTNKRAGRAVYQLEPGYYVTRTGKNSAGKKPPEELIAVDTAGQIHNLEHPGPEKDALRPLGKAGRRGDVIDQPGAYAGTVCYCEAPATTHQTDTRRARCADHYRPPATQETPPEPPTTYDPDPADILEDAPETIPAYILEEWARTEEATR